MFRLPFVLLVLVLGGCDSGIDAWEGILNADIDQDGDIAGDENGGTAGNGGIAFPDGVDRVHDLAVVGSTLWLWADDTADDVDGPVLIPVSISTGEPGNSVTIQNRPGLLNAGSEVAWDGAAFWFTSDGNVAQAELYQVQRDGTVATTLPCPFSGVAECQGVAWDGSFLWTGEKNGTQVTRVNTIPGGVVPSPFSPWGSTTGTIDFLFAEETADTSRALVVRNGLLYWIDSTTESATEGPAVEFDRGGANAGTVWYASNTDRRLFSRSVPPPP